MRALAAALFVALLPTVAPHAQTVTVDSLAVGGSGMGGPVGAFTLYSLAEQRVVPNADSASTAWDIGLRGTTIIVNGGASGPGAGAATLVEAPFDAVTAADDLVFLADGEGDCPRGALAICTGSGNGWYLYTGNGVQPLPDRTLVVRLADGSRVAKLRILSYTLSEPLADGSRPRYYRFDVAPIGG